ncbi:hypothetical protein Bca52824_054465 [Brassica carinata]|uniref:No apical meristem-associated C-terminal domain-containing protein n=1 Tax=Brassica carinata TaxID=52824 RepID=A0A8X7UKI9_BRACI|nr:hypothetical protein Bca52824_054465 [Brassica carinata]
MDFNPFQDSAKFVELLNSQQKVVFGSQGSASRSSSQVPFFTKNESTSKRRKFEDGSHSASSQVPENAVDVDGTSRPPGVKASKARGKNPQAEEKQLSDFQSMWSIKQNDLAMKERLSKMRILENLLAKDPPLADYEEVIMKKLINELM